MATITQTHTYAEILQQPQMWRKEFQQILADKERINAFVSKYLADYEIILTGAGTSAFIGDVLSVCLQQKGLHNCRAVATTDIITHPTAYFSKGRKILLVSFARSGNSPESVGAVNLANQYCSDIAHVFITCNKDGALAKMAKTDNTLLLLLPAETNDVSLAMTSSFTTMAMACLMMTDVKCLNEVEPAIEAACANAQAVLDNNLHALQNLTARDYERAVFLGSGPLRGIAEECHLKQQELTDGAVVCKFDSFLGFRHGPKAVINSKTLIVYLFSDDEKVQRYERDLVAQINSNNTVVGQVAVSCGGVMDIPGVNFSIDVTMPHTSAETKEYGFIPYVLVGQLLGFFKSGNMGLNPDAPSVSGNIARVVEGVTIYN